MKIQGITDQYVMRNLAVDYHFFSNNSSDALQTYICDIHMDFEACINIYV